MLLTIALFEKSFKNTAINATDMLGRQVYNAALPPGEIQKEISLENVAAGIYQLTMYRSNTSAVFKITITR